MPALQISAGPRARALLRERGLHAADVRVIPGAAGGPKGLALIPLDRFLFGHWLVGCPQQVHLPGASIGAWRLACACLPDADAALAQLAEDYITQHYAHAPGRAPTPTQVSATFGRKLEVRLGARASEVLAHPRFRLHVFASHGRQLLGREGRWRTPLGYLGAVLSNAAGRRALGLWLERVVFSDPRDALPLPLADFRSQRVPMTAQNLTPAILASCSIPFWLDAVHDVPGAPRGAYWDGGITDYHLRLNYAALDEQAGPGWRGGSGLVLYPHFQSRIVPGWFDKAWRHRHRAGPDLSNVVVVSPSPAWLATLPGAKLPDRGDFKAYGDDHPRRQRDWRRALAESQRLADEFAALVAVPRPFDALPLA